MAKLGKVTGEVIFRIAGVEEVVGTIEIPVSVGSGKDGHAVVRFPKDTVRHQLKKIGKRIARSLA
jgi:hypothetical protein